MNLNTGDLISHYKIIERIGAGGMGVVYKAEDTRLKRTVALKFLPQDETLLPHAKERFIHEAQTASALDHPNICTIHEISETDDGQMFLVMSCYEGETLRGRLHRQALSAHESVAIAIQLCDGLAAAHGKNIIHRDLKPDNIMVLSDGLVKIVDFGLAKFLGQTKLTTEGTTLGTIAYMSPEQVRSEDADHRTDIYSLSVILYEMLTGQLPFQGDHYMATFYLIVTQPPPSPRSVNSAIPEELERVVLTGMNKERDSRYQSCAALKEALLSRTDAGMAIAPGQAVVLPARREGEMTDGMQLSHLPAWKKRSVYGALGLAMMVVTGLAIFLLRTPGSGDGRATAHGHLERAIAFMDNDRLAEAQGELESAVTADPSYSLAWSSMAAVNTRLGNLDRAVTQSRRAVSLDPGNANAHYNLAYALEEKGEVDEALTAYGEAVRTDSTYLPAQSALANLYIRLDMADKAAVILQRALQIAPDSRYAFLLYRNLGRAYLKTNRVDESIAALTRSIALKPDQDPEPLYILATAYRARGMFREAREELQKYLAAEADSSRRREARELLQTLGGE